MRKNPATWSRRAKQNSAQVSRNGGEVNGRNDVCESAELAATMPATVSSSERVCAMVFIAAHYYWRARAGTMTTELEGPEVLICW